MNILIPLLLFILKIFTVVFAVLLLFGGILSLKKSSKLKFEIELLNKEYDELRGRLHKLIYGKKLKKDTKSKKTTKANIFLIDFIGDIKASQVEGLRDAITAILLIANPKDEVMIRLESPGGTVNGYGLAASQLQRIRDRDLSLTVCIDKIAASGGYLMACVANRILAAPFAIIGSIGVVAQLPNFHRLLKKNNIDVELMTAGDYKRTLTMFGENTDKGREKFQEDIDKIHIMFINYILNNRKPIDVDKVATGEHWLASDAIHLNLIDELKTSDDYIFDKTSTHQIFKITPPTKLSLLDKILKPAVKWTSYWS